MDLKTSGPEATEEEIEAVAEVLGPASSRWEGGPAADLDDRLSEGGRRLRDQRHQLLPVLHALRDRVGWVSRGGLEHACRRLGVPPAEAYGVASFYALLPLSEQPPLAVHVCDDLACRDKGGLEICTGLERRFGPAGTAVAGATWHRSPCLGLCDRAPAVFMQRAGAPRARAEGRLAPASLAGTAAIVEGGAWPVDAEVPLPQAGSPDLKLLRRVGTVDPESLDSYRKGGGYEALRRALEIGPEGVIREVTDSQLLGRGGAAFPTGRKWEAVAKAPVRPHLLVCNADESEPGTFKDRVLMERDPFAVLEAITIAGVTTGCERGYVYIRGEYPLARQRMEHAIHQARAHGLLGEDIMGRGIGFEVEVRRGAGAYICGEETALFNSIEGRRGEPRNKPPFPVASGLFGKPTVVNNVETLVNVIDIVLEGGAAYAAIGTADSTGTRLFCLSGEVRRPGLYEVPFGTTLRQLLELAGGLHEGRRLRAILLGGAAGSFVTEEHLDVQLTFAGVRAVGATLGSGVVLVLDDTTDLEGFVLRIARFFRDESCGQCVPCRVGTQRLEELLHRLAAGAPRTTRDEELKLFDDVARAMRDASICGLGQTAPNALESALIRLGAFNGRQS